MSLRIKARIQGLSLARLLVAVFLLLGSLTSLNGCSSSPQKAVSPDSPKSATKAAPTRGPDHSDDHEGATPSEGQLPQISGGSGSIPPGYFDWPVYEARMTRGYFTKAKKRRGRPHWGIDLAARKGTPILASHEGLVIYVGREFRGFGRLIMIEGKGGFATLYAHLSKSRVRVGQRVKQGQTIGDMGNTGRSTGVHLHFEIRRRSGPIDPLQYLPGGAKIAKNSK